MTRQFVREYVSDAKSATGAVVECLAADAVRAAGPHLLEAKVKKDAVQGCDDVKITITVEPRQ